MLELSCKQCCHINKQKSASCVQTLLKSLEGALTKINLTSIFLRTAKHLQIFTHSGSVQHQALLEACFDFAGTGELLYIFQYKCPWWIFWDHLYGTHHLNIWRRYWPCVDKISSKSPVPKHNLNNYKRDRCWTDPICVQVVCMHSEKKCVEVW